MNRCKLLTRCATLLPVAALALGGCATAPDPIPAGAIPARFKEQGPLADGRWTTAHVAEAQPRGDWWRAFGDPTLDALVSRAADNLSIQQGLARVRQARAFSGQADAARSVQVDLGASASRQTGADRQRSTAPSTRVGANLGISYKVDLFGRLSRDSDAARLDLRASEAMLQSTRLLVQSQVAQTYLALRATDAEIAILGESLQAYRDTLGLTERRRDAGDVAELDVVRMQAEVSATESETFALERRRAELEHALAVLVDTAPAEFSLGAGEWTGALPHVPPGVPATVLTRRPDVSAARAALLAAQARVGVAQAAYFPAIALTGGGGHASSDLGNLFQWSARSWGIGALLSLPLFDGGRRDAAVERARGQLDEALVGYRAQVLVAFREVEDHLAALRLLREQSDTQATAVASAQRATELSDKRYRIGYVSQLELLDARRSELRTRRNALQVRAAQYQSTVALIRALGGGWGA